MADQADQGQAVAQFVALTGASPEQATQYLQAHGWNVMPAVDSFYSDDEERKAESREPEVADEAYTGPRTLDGRPAPQQASGSRTSRKPAVQPKKKGIATLGSLGSSSHQHDDDDDGSDDDYDEDDDDEGRGNLFAGGEKSGLAVQDPGKEGGSKKLIGDILAKAKANSNRPDAAAPEAGPSRSAHFHGTGMTLGGEGVESRSIPDPRGAAARRTNAEPQERVLHIWQDGFSIDDGELRRFDDPANMADLAMIRQGRAPLHLMNVQHDAPVDVKLHQHEGPYVPQPKKYRPFGGEGRRLGSPVPGDGSASAQAAPPPTSTPAQSAPVASGSSDVNVDSSQPTISLRIQLPDGTRLPARFNTTHTVDDVYGFIQRASAETQTRPWVLATTFPNKEHTDKSLVLGEMAEFKKGGTAVVKWT